MLQRSILGKRGGDALHLYAGINVLATEEHREEIVERLRQSGLDVTAAVESVRPAAEAKVSE
jgi:hypothetical protein